MIDVRTAVCLVASLFAIQSAHAQDAAPRPNIVLLLSDDQGFGDVGFRGHPRLKTPHLDAMAAAGLVLDRYYAAAPVCSPTRASILTGKHPMRLGIPGANSGHIPHTERTLAEIASDAGYRTGFFGKWHLGTLTTKRVDSNRGGRPEHLQHCTTPSEHGFHTWFATEAKVPTYDPMLRPANGEPYGTAYWNGRTEPVTDNVDGDDSRIIVDRVEPFVRDSVAMERPFLAVVWFHAPHLPVVAGEEMLERYKDVEDDETRRYYGCLTALDAEVGRVRALLRELSVERDTLVWFGSDNGPEGQAGRAPGSAGQLRGRKRDLFEGGVRVPGIVEWPRHIKTGRHSTVPCFTSDLLPTLAPLLGGEAPAGLDGVDLGSMLRGEAFERERPIAFWYGRRRALIDGNKKIVTEDGGETWHLFDLAKDPIESLDLAAQEPERLKALVAAFESWRSTIE